MICNQHLFFLQPFSSKLIVIVLLMTKLRLSVLGLMINGLMASFMSVISYIRFLEWPIFLLL